MAILFGVGPNDPATFAVVSLGLTLIALVAAKSSNPFSRSS